jgi:hypothetical protein
MTFLIITRLFMHESGHAQQTNADKVGLYAGWGTCVVRDRLMTPMTYSDGFPSLKIVYYGTASKGRHFAQVGTNWIRFASTTGHWMNGVMHCFEYSYHRQIRSVLDGSTRLFLGVSSYNIIATRKIIFPIRTFGTERSEYTSGEYFFTVNLSVMAERTFGPRYAARLHSTLPLLGYVVRPPYSIAADWSYKNGKIRSIGRCFFSKTKAAFEARLGKRFNLVCSYTLVYYSINDPFKVQSFNHEIGTEILFRF